MRRTIEKPIDKGILIRLMKRMKHPEASPNQKKVHLPQRPVTPDGVTRHLSATRWHMAERTGSMKVSESAANGRSTEARNNIRAGTPRIRVKTSFLPFPLPVIDGSDLALPVNKKRPDHSVQIILVWLSGSMIPR